MAVGPGLGKSEESLCLLREVLSSWTGPLVMDADALNLMAAHPELKPEGNGSAVITPHPGEMARLLNAGSAEGTFSASGVAAFPVDIARDYAKKSGFVTVLKGARTIISDGEETWMNLTGNEGMATGGSGDTLTGIIGSLLAQGLFPAEAARAGVLLHSAAGDAAAGALGTRSLIAGDIADYIPQAVMGGN